MRVRVICSLRLLGCFPRVQTSADPEIHRSHAEALGLKRVTRLESVGRASCPVSREAIARPPRRGPLLIVQSESDQAVAEGSFTGKDPLRVEHPWGLLARCYSLWLIGPCRSSLASCASFGFAMIACAPTMPRPSPAPAR